MEERDRPRDADGLRGRLSDYFDAARALIVVLDTAGKVRLVNRYGCEVLEGTEAEIVGRDWFETFLLPEDVDSVRRVFERIVDGEIAELEEYENPIRTLRGRRREFFWSNAILRDSRGGVAEILSAGSDLSRRNLSARAEREAAERQTALLNALPDLMFRLSGSGIHLDFHAPGRGALAVAPEAFMGKSVAEVLPADVAEAFMRSIREALEGSEPVRFEYDLSLPERGLCSYEARMVASGSDEVLVIVQDTTERRRLEARVRQSQKMEALGQLAAGVAHDFNNMLTAILGNAELASRMLPSEASEVLRESLDQIAETARSAAGLTKRLLGFTRQRAIEPMLLDVSGILARMTAVLRRLIGENIELVVHAPPDLQAVWADAGQIEQVLINLAVNARDAIESHGLVEIRLAAHPLHAPQEDWPGLAPGDYVLLTVRDDGRGMSEATAARVFEPFFTTKPVGHGTGLGLSTVYGIVRQCGGQIQVSSEPEEGTTFRVLLPSLPREPLDRGRATETPHNSAARTSSSARTSTRCAPSWWTSWRRPAVRWSPPVRGLWRCGEPPSWGGGSTSW